jgi:hypothetical protein
MECVGIGSIFGRFALNHEIHEIFIKLNSLEFCQFLTKLINSQAQLRNRFLREIRAQR